MYEGTYIIVRVFDKLYRVCNLLPLPGTADGSRPAHQSDSGERIRVVQCGVDVRRGPHSMKGERAARHAVCARARQQDSHRETERRQAELDETFQIVNCTRR